MKVFLIDIREHEELKEKYLKSNKDNIIVLHISMSRIENYVQKIKTELLNEGFIYLVCRSGNRANIVKSRYFSNQINVQTIGSIENAAETFKIELIKN